MKAGKLTARYWALVAISAMGPVHAEIVPAGTNDMTATLAEAIDACRDGGTVELAEGEYHFYAENARSMEFFVSNHDQTRPRLVQVAVENAKDLALKGLGRGARLIFHGVSTGILVMDSARVRLENLELDWEASPIGEARIAGFEPDGRPRLEFRVRGSDGFGNAQMLWDGRTHAIKPGTGDVFDLAQAETGDTISFRTWERPAPAICLYRAENVVFENVVIHAAHGMGLLAQRSADIAWRFGGVYPREGCFCSTKADATHFSNCKGLVSVTGARFEGMMDDAINIHATCLRIEEKLDGNRWRCRYMHEQAYGFEVFAPGETLRFIRARTLENGPVAKVVAVTAEDERTVVLSLDREVAGFGPGDAVENADWQPAVEFNCNTVRNNRARAALFTTSGRVVARGNMFDHVSGSAILLAGDASNWYESGACADVEISGNRFIDCLTSPYQFCNAVITVAPSVPDLEAQRAPYHRNLRIFGNVFASPGAKLWDAVSADEVEWRDNLVLQPEAGDELGRDVAFILKYAPPQDCPIPGDYVTNNCRLAQLARQTAIESYPDDIYLDYVLPYSVIREGRDDWRGEFRERFLPLVDGCTNAYEAAVKLDRTVWDMLNVHYNVKRDRARQSPRHSMRIGMASCTGISIILIDICRALGIPARLVGCNWTTIPGNHSWVEVWSEGRWRVLASGEKEREDDIWFLEYAAQADASRPDKRIYASRWSPSPEGTRFWRTWEYPQGVSDVPADDVTGTYRK